MSSLPLRGEANEVVLESSPDGRSEMLAYVATGSYGLAVVDVTQFQQPLLLGELQLAGTALDVSVDTRMQIAAVASNAGLHLIDVSNPRCPQLLNTIHGNFHQVEVHEGFAYAMSEGSLRAHDLFTGDRRQLLDLSANTLTGLAREGDYLYSLDNGGRMTAMEITAAGIIVRSSLELPEGRSTLFVGGAIAYVAADDGFNGGFATVDVSDPDNLVLISRPDDGSIAGHRIAPNGSGLGIAVGNPGGVFGVEVLDVLDLSDPANTAGFLTRFTLPAAPRSVALGGGIAFVANGTAGLQVVNYLSFDSLGIAPTVTASLDHADMDPAEGIHVEEGARIQVHAQIADDVQVRNVELLVNGQVVHNDLSFPFDLNTTLPTLADNNGSQVTIQVRATDTGGNVGLSLPMVVELVPDTFPPILESSNLADGARRGVSFRAVTFSFSEALDPATINAQTFVLTGADGPIPPLDIQTRSGGRTVQLTYPSLPLGDYSFLIQAANVTDLPGNALGSDDLTYQFEIIPCSAVWTNTAGGDWNDPLNWGSGAVPGPSDDVLINVPGDALITFSEGYAEVRSVISFEPLTLVGGTLEVTDFLQVNHSLSFAGGHLKNTNLLQGTGADASIGVAQGTYGSMLEGVTLHSDVIVHTNSVLRIRNHLTLVNATLEFLHPDDTYIGSYIVFEGHSQLLGTGTVILEQNNWGYSGSLYVNDSLTIGAQVTVRGSGNISGQTLINEGTIRADQPETTLHVQVSTLVNRGILAASNGAAIVLSGNIQLEPSSVLTVELGGTEAGEFGLISFASTVSLAGTLNIVTAAGYTPSVGDSFTIVTFPESDGAFDTVAGNGLTYSVSVDADSVTITRVAALLADGLPPAASAQTLSQYELETAVTAAISRWDAAGLGETQRNLLLSLQFVVADLDVPGRLGEASGRLIRIDDNAAGHGWYVDRTPEEDEEFVLSPNGIGRAVEGGPAAGKIDLLTAVMHELAHALGLEHSDDPDDLLYESLAAGQRKGVLDQHLAAAFAAWE